MRIFLDSNSAISLSKSGTKANPFAGLNAILARGNQIVVPDTVYYEVVTKSLQNNPQQSDAINFKNWLAVNDISPEATSIGKSDAKNAGERAILELINNPDFVGSPYTIITDDNRLSSPNGFDWQSSGISAKNLSGTVNYLNSLWNAGSISANELANIRTSMFVNASTTPNISGFYPDSKIGAVPELASDGSPVYGEPNAKLIDLSNPPLSSPGTSPDQAIDGEAAKLSSALAADGVSGYAELVAGMVASSRILAAAGLAGMAYGSFKAAETAEQQVKAGNVSGALLTLENYTAASFLALTGAEVVGVLGAEVGAASGGTLGFAFGGPIGGAVGGLVGGLAGGILGSIAGAVAGGVGGLAALQSLENALAGFLKSVSGAATAAGVNTDFPYSAGINNAGGGSVITTYEVAPIGWTGWRRR